MYRKSSTILLKVNNRQESELPWRRSALSECLLLNVCTLYDITLRHCTESLRNEAKYYSCAMLFGLLNTAIRPALKINGCKICSAYMSSSFSPHLVLSNLSWRN